MCICCLVSITLHNFYLFCFFTAPSHLHLNAQYILFYVTLNDIHLLSINISTSHKRINICLNMKSSNISLNMDKEKTIFYNHIISTHRFKIKTLPLYLIIYFYDIFYLLYIISLIHNSKFFVSIIMNVIIV